MAPKRNLRDLPFSIFELEKLSAQPEIGEAVARRVIKWVLLHGLHMTNLRDIPYNKICVHSKAAEFISNNCILFSVKIVEALESNRGDTIKLLLELQDGHRVETVIMKHTSRSTVCVSSQIGCQMGCKFCATGTLGIIGNLTSGEIVEQVALACRYTSVRNVVFMGMGEPLNNYDNVKSAVQFMTNDKLLALSPRHVTVSTVGVLTTMKRMTREMPSINLALSLHAPNQAVRIQIVPAAAANNIDKLMAAVDEHVAANPFAKATDHSLGSHTKRRIAGVMIEYILIKDVNDRPEHAHELGQLLSSRRGHILLNLIPYNPTAVMDSYAAPPSESIDTFYQICISEPYRIMTRIRREMGQDIAGACGQLALIIPKEQTAANGSASSNGGSASKDVDIEDYFSNRKRAKIDEHRGNADKSSSTGGTPIGINNTLLLLKTGLFLSLGVASVAVVAVGAFRFFSMRRQVF